MAMPEWNERHEMIKMIVMTGLENPAQYGDLLCSRGRPEKMQAWVYVSLALSRVLPLPIIRPVDGGRYVLPGLLAYGQNASATLGPRHLLRCWGRHRLTTPFVAKCHRAGAETFLRMLRYFDNDTDDENSHSSDSPTHADSDFSDLAYGDHRPLTWAAGTLSDSNEVKVNLGARMNAFVYSIGIGDAEVLQCIKQYRVYLTRSNYARRMRRQQRRDRRLSELRASAPVPAFDPEARRAEILSAEQVPQPVAQEPGHAGFNIRLLEFEDDPQPVAQEPGYAGFNIRLLEFEDNPHPVAQEPGHDGYNIRFLDFAYEPQPVAQEPGHAGLNIGLEFADDPQPSCSSSSSAEAAAEDSGRPPLPRCLVPTELAVWRVNDLRNLLRKEIVKTWMQFYGAKLRMGVEDKLSCWMTPVRFVRQNGPNCGLAALAMALRPVLTCEVMAGGAADGGCGSGRGLDQELEVVDDVIAATDWAVGETMRVSHDGGVPFIVGPNGRNLFNAHMDVPDLEQIQREAVRRGYTGRGEMFSAWCLAELARSDQLGRHIVRLVKRDLLADNLMSSALRGVPRIEVQSDGVTASEFGMSWMLSVVDRLMRGYLIAVCFDSDKSMMPGMAAGSQAHWGLLCGVVVLTNDQELTEEHYFKPALDLERDADRVWVVARHGKMAGPRYALWSLRELANSNRQLRAPSDDMLRSNEVAKRADLPVRDGLATKRPRVETAPDGPNRLPSQARANTSALNQEPAIPPPPPPSSSATVQQSDGDSDHEIEVVDESMMLPPFVFPEGEDLEKSLANQYVSFEPFFHPNVIGDHLPSFDYLVADPLSPIQCFFTYKKKDYFKI